MSLDPADEPPIDNALAHYMEARALDIAREKAGTPAERAKLATLCALRERLMTQRGAFDRQAVAARHARGEVYSAARVAAINAMGPTRDDMDRDVRTLYAAQSSVDEVLRTHARTHFVYALMSSRLLLAEHTPDIAAAARAMQQQEEAFAAAWLACIGDDAFLAEVRALQREALGVLRTSTRAMYFVAQPDTVASVALDDTDAQVLGKAWKKLDELAVSLGQAPLSGFIAVPGEDDAAGVDAAQLLPVVDALLAALSTPAHKLSGKRATLAVLGKLREALVLLAQQGGRGYFDIDL
ncbi:hypothetical protein [Uliginosibacterium sp. H1]|uniref:hypothetical protein n=1 Tax=Uliginosibacterium sp. H1 TaxID=3114757 RepID=UPI002E17BB11|nr:hypothetical protein [Uliginosibacterium sp. H1]